MQKTILTFLSLLAVLVCSAQSIAGYKSLDTKNPIVFGGNYVVYHGDTIKLGPKAFFIDGQLNDEEAAKYHYVFNTVNKAAEHLTDGAEESPMVLYIAPFVYWIDNPDDPEIRLPKSMGGTPFGLEIKCEWLKFYGLSDDAKNVVLASNRGQTMGAKGNFTMFRISGNGTSAENITFGNYCNIDLEYPLKPELNREKRGSAIVQAQLVFCDGDKLLARNARFISRLNLCPFVGGKRTFFDRCYFESTDDALNGNAVYLDCSFDFYSSKPFWGTSGTGAVFLNCDIHALTRGDQYFVKSSGQVAVVDSRFVSETSNYIGWKDMPAKDMRNYQYNNKLNGRPFNIGLHDPECTVDMSGKSVFDAYRFKHNGQVIYNTYNLLRGNDEWDPMGVKNIVLATEKKNGKSYNNLPTQLLISSTHNTIETGKNSIVLKTRVNKFGDYELKGEKVSWSIAPEYKSLVTLKDNLDGTCEVIPTNENDETKTVIVTASTSSGLEAANVIYVSPSMLEAPKFSSLPVLRKNSDGSLSIDYKLDMRFKDQSLVSWYRCSDEKGSNPIEVAVSRFNVPKRNYQLSVGDIGWYIMAKVMPKHIRCEAGKSVAEIAAEPVSDGDVKADNHILNADLSSLSTKYQPEVKPGFWTLDCFAPTDTRDWTADNSKDPWYYGIGVDGAAQDTGLVQANKGARLRYTPVGEKFGDMKISFTAVPAKTAGQGFSSARQQYMDVFIKFDTEKLNGYALRLIRTTKYADALDFELMKYENGLATPISNAVSASCYRPDCHITVEAKANKLIVHAENTKEYYIIPNRPEVVHVVDMEADITPNNYGGFGFQHTGTVGSGATLIKDLKIVWE